VQRIATECESV